MTKRNTIKKTLVEQILDKANIEYDSLIIDAFKETLPNGIEKSHIFKTLALTGDKTGPIIGIVPITERLSEKKLANVSKNKKVSMIPQKKLQQTTGYVHGANNPVGIHQRHRFPIFIDNQALNIGKIIVSAGEIGHSIRIDSQILAEFVNAHFADLIDDSH